MRNPVAIALEFVDEGAGWFHLNVRAGDTEYCVGGSSYVTRPIGDLLRAALAMVADADRADVWFNAEPSVLRLTVRRELLNRTESGDGWEPEWGCRVMATWVDQNTLVDGDPEFDILCWSPIAFARATLQMAKPHCREDAVSFRPFVALEGALRAVDETTR
jgi:hypothetical protein